MSKSWAFLFFLLVASLTLSCSSSRKLQSITISQTVNGQQIQFVASGAFSAPPITVNPLPAFWSIDLPPAQYTLTTQPFVVPCNSVNPGGGPIVAWAPADPNAPSTGSISGTKMIVASAAPMNCQ